MNDAYSEAIKEAFALAPHNKVVLHTIEIRQTTVQDPIYLVQARQGIEAIDEDGQLHSFEPVGFSFSLPPSNEEGFRSLNVAIDNVGRRISAFVEAAKSAKVPVEMWYRPYLSDDLTAPQMDPPLVLYLKELQITAMQVTGRATFMDVVNRKFPADLYTRARFVTLG